MALALSAGVIMFALKACDLLPLLSADDRQFRDQLRASLHDPGDWTSLEPVVRGARRACVISPYARRDDVVQRLGAPLHEDDLAFTAWEDWWGLALAGPQGVRVIKARRREGDVLGRDGPGPTCWDAPHDLRVVLVSVRQEHGYEWREIDIRR